MPNKLNDQYYTCDKCNGRGNIPTKNPDVVKQCSKCFGKKQLDWIENLVGVTKYKPTFDEVQQDILNVLSMELAKKIDEEILNSIFKETDKDEKKLSQVRIDKKPSLNLNWNIS